MMNLWHKLGSYFTSCDFGLEHYLASSVDVIELEYRERKWMRMSESERNFWANR
jgi:hypothetical protein